MIQEHITSGHDNKKTYDTWDGRTQSDWTRQNKTRTHRFAMSTFYVFFYSMCPMFYIVVSIVIDFVHP